MSARGIKSALFVALIALALVRHDLWWWYDASQLFGLPIGLFYHAAFCLAVSVVMALLVKFAWPLSAQAERVAAMSETGAGTKEA